MYSYQTQEETYVCMYIQTYVHTHIHPLLTVVEEFHPAKSGVCGYYYQNYQGIEGVFIVQKYKQRNVFRNAAIVKIDVLLGKIFHISNISTL